MNPKETYKIIIDNAKKRNPDTIGMYEIHHIKPRCLGGSDNIRNLVKLTLREHYFCHYLLTLIYPKHNGINLAYCLMSYGKIISTRQYEKSRKAYGYYSKKTINQCNQSRCLVFMWRYLCKIKCTRPSRKTILKGWKNRNGYQSNKWRECYKSDDDWVTNVRLYLKENPVDVNYVFKRNNSIEGKNKQQGSIVANSFIRKIKDKTMFEKVEQKNGKWIITKTFIINAKYYYPKRRRWLHLKWRNYFTKKEWLNKIISELNKLDIDYIECVF